MAAFSACCTGNGRKPSKFRAIGHLVAEPELSD
jgi:hypothetical protein